MTVGQPPFLGKNEEDLFSAIVKKRILFPPWSSKEVMSLVNGLTMKKQEARLGFKNNVTGIKQHAFFHPLDWLKLQAGELKVPFVPEGSPGDTANFDKEFTSEEVALTPTDADLVDSIDQREFEGFSFVNAAFDTT